MNSTVWKEKLSAIRDSFSVSIAKTPAESPEAIELHYLGRKGELALLLRDLKDIPIEERKELGALGNTAKQEMEAKLEELHQQLGDPALYQKDPSAIPQIQKQLEALEQELKKAYGRWEALEAVKAGEA